jgi:dienelactone hydrolase
MNSLRRRSLLLALGAALPALALHRPAHAAGTGEVLDLSWSDASRQRTLPLRLRLPVPGSTAAAKAPLVLFSHGLGGSVEAGTAWAQTWARLGIATLHLQHPGSDRETLRQGFRELRRAASAEQLLARAADVRFVLDESARRQAAGEPALAALDLGAIGLAGHSFGAHTTLAIAGQSYGRGGRLPSLADPRPRAFAAFSPSPGNDWVSEAERSFGEIRRPMLCLTGSLDDDPLGRFTGGSPERQGTGSWRRAVYDALPAGDKAELWLDGADHMTFGGQDMPGRSAAGGGARPGLRNRGEGQGERGRLSRPEAAIEQQARHRVLIEAVSAGWWWAHLRGDRAARDALARAPEGLGAKDEWRRG